MKSFARLNESHKSVIDVMMCNERVGKIVKRDFIVANNVNLVSLSFQSYRNSLVL